MVSTSLTINSNISDILKGRSREEIAFALQATSNMAIKAYIDEMPRNMSDASRSVRLVEKGDLFYKVAPTAKTKKGFPYPVAVATGTNKWRDSAFDFGRTRGGRVREARYTDDEIAMFAGIQKRTKGKGISIPPDQFDIRATAQLEDRIPNYFITAILERNA